MHPDAELTDIDTMAAAMAEQFNAFVKAGIPPTSAAVIIGTWLGTAGSHNAEGSDGA